MYSLLGIFAASTGALLSMSWLTCWYFMFVRSARTTSVSVRESSLYLGSGYLLAFVLIIWSEQMWFGGIEPQASSMLAVSWLLVISGQALLVLGRAALPLSNTDLLVRLAQQHTRVGVQHVIGHPMYLGLFVATTGSSLLVGNVGALLVCSFIGAALAVRIAAERWG